MREDRRVTKALPGGPQSQLRRICRSGKTAEALQETKARDEMGDEVCLLVCRGMEQWARGKKMCQSVGVRGSRVKRGDLDANDLWARARRPESNATRIS